MVLCEFKRRNDWNMVSPVFLKPSSCVSPCVGREPMISASGTNVYVTYPMGGYGGVSPYDGKSPSATIMAKPGSLDLSGGLSNIREVQVTSYGSDVYVTSRGTVSGIKGVQQYVYVSTDNGNTFSVPIPLASPALSGPENGFGGFALDQTSGNVYVQWPHGTTSQAVYQRKHQPATTLESRSAGERIDQGGRGDG